jgi:hypothetical protein
MGSKPAIRRPRWYGIPLRVALVTFLLSILSFAVSLLSGIIGIVLIAKTRGGTPNLTLAYRDIAAPVAAVVGVIVLVLSLAMEIRHYRQAKALAEIERAG